MADGPPRTTTADPPRPDSAEERFGGEPQRVGRVFIALYASTYMGTCLVLIAPLLITLAPKVDAVVGKDQAPNSLALVTGVGALAAMLGNPFFGKLSDRTSGAWGMRRPWMVVGLLGGSLGVLVVAAAPTVPVILVGWCVAQLLVNALLAALLAVLPDQVPVTQRGLVSGVLGVCLPVASVGVTFGPAVRGSPDRHVPDAVRDRGVLRAALRGHTARPPAPPGGQTALVAGRGRGHLLRQPAEEPGLRVGLRQPLPVRAGLRVPDHVPDVLPAGRDRHRRGRGPAADLPGHAHPGRRARRRVLPQRQARGPVGPAQDLRVRRVGRLRPGDVRGRRRH